MTIPALLFSFLIALLIGALFHAIRGGGGWRLLLHLGLSIFGFALGQVVSIWVDFIFFRIGIIDLGAGIIGCLVILGVGDWLSRIKPGNESGV